MSVSYFDDILMQHISAINSLQDDIIIPNTGRTQSLVETAGLAKENDASIIDIATD